MISTFKKMTFILSLLVSFLLLAQNNVQAMKDEEAARQLEGFTWFSEEYPPFNFVAPDGNPQGLAVEILMAAFDKAGINVPLSSIKIVPWNQSYDLLLNKPGTALFSMVYTPEREKVMKYVGPAADANVSVISLAENGFQVESKEDLADLRIGAVLNDVGDLQLQVNGIEKDQIIHRNALKQLIFMLVNNEIDAIAYIGSVFSHVTKQLNYDPRMFDELYVLKESKVGYAFNMQTDDKILAPLQKAIDTLREEGKIAEIIAKYNN